MDNGQQTGWWRVMSQKNYELRIKNYELQITSWNFYSPKNNQVFIET